MPMTAAPAAHRSSILRSTGAILLGLIAIVALSLGTDQILHVLNVYPPWGQPMHEPGLNLLALSYRCIFGIFGSYIAARFAPNAPMRHALTLGLLGVVLSTAGAVSVMNMEVGPIWYPIALVVTALPCAWLGAVLYLSRHSGD